jgi:hypothetical protein
VVEMYTIEKIVKNIKEKTDIDIRESHSIFCYGLYNPEENWILYDPKHPDEKVIETLIHEIYHYITNVQSKGLDTFNNEIGAHISERVILDGADIEETFEKLEEGVRYTYDAKGVRIITTKEIEEIIEGVKKLIGDE